MTTTEIYPWISADEHNPHDNELVLAFGFEAFSSGMSNYIPFLAWHDAEGWHLEDDTIPYLVAGWMPIPEIPEIEGGV